MTHIPPVFHRAVIRTIYNAEGNNVTGRVKRASDTERFEIKRYLRTPRTSLK